MAKPKKASRRGHSEEDQKSSVSCKNCEVKIKDSSNIKKCRCVFWVFCSNNCRKKSDHFKSCDGAKDEMEDIKRNHPNEFPFPESAGLVNNLERRNFALELQSLSSKSFDELLNMDDNAVACFMIGVSLGQHLTGEAVIAGGLNKEYEDMTFFEKYAASTKWFKKSHDLGCYMATGQYGTQLVSSQENMGYDGRTGMKYLAMALKKGETEYQSMFRKYSNVIQQIELMTSNIQDGKPGDKVILYTESLGGLIIARCSHLLLDVIKDRSGVGLSKDELGFKELYKFREIIKKSPTQFEIYPAMLDITEVNEIQKNEDFEMKNEKSKHSTKYVAAPNFNAEDSMNDLKKVVEGPEEIEKSDHARYGRCEHLRSQDSATGEMKPIFDQVFLPMVVVCPVCFKNGTERVRAVASQAYCLSKNYVEKYGEYSYYFSAIFEVEVEGRRKTKKERFLGYCQEEVDSILRLLSIHSADVDPRMICINLHLYWSIIWFYGSVTKALEEAGGQRLYNIGFGNHAVSESSMQDLMAMMQLQDNLKLDSNTKLLTENFVTMFENQNMAWRYICCNPGCDKLEDNTKFLSCGGCVKIRPRKYCSQVCQAEDWPEHQKQCKSLKEEQKQEAWKIAQQRKKTKEKKQF